MVRRDFITSGLALLGTSAFAVACAKTADITSPGPSSGQAAGTTAAPGTTAQPGTSTTTLPISCELTPEQMEGPYYLDTNLLRDDITEGKPGTPLQLALTVVDTKTCTPLAGVPVDIWHCDAMGTYSGYEGINAMTPTHAEPVDTKTFLRGTQRTDDHGRCTFRTIVPGWYPLRAVHIHVKVHPTDTTQAMTQLYFPDEFLDTVFADEPYADHVGTYVPRAKDLLQGGPPPLDLNRQGDGYDTAFTVGIA